ncbi:glucosyltransferase domain-containing protein [Pantoea sp.]|uniref:glucosyltransferase domain-containing protein n=1 Tax=Pantoea sp. TaxID=69393 RepID=UPI0039E5D2C1
MVSHPVHRVGALATLSFFANPYLAEVFSYRFDVLTLSCALALSLVWVLLPPLNRIVRFVTGIASIIAIYSLYQIAVNVAVMMALVVTFRQIIKTVKEWRCWSPFLSWLLSPPQLLRCVISEPG